MAEIGINHGGIVALAKLMIDSAKRCGAQCVKFQYTIPREDMLPTMDAWDTINRASFCYDEHVELKRYTESLGLIYLCTPFSATAARNLNDMGVVAFKVASGDCDNLPLIEQICGYGKPIIISTGMTNIVSLRETVELVENYGIPYALLHCNAVYPTPDHFSRLHRITELKRAYPRAVVGFSDHTVHNRFALAAVAMGATIIEKHFTTLPTLPWPDNSISLTPDRLTELVTYSQLIYDSVRGAPTGDDESPVAAVAKKSMVTTTAIRAGEYITAQNTAPKRPGSGEIRPREYRQLYGCIALCDIPKDTQLKWDWLGHG